jgi:hypothetical protein
MQHGAFSELVSCQCMNRRILLSFLSFTSLQNRFLQMSTFKAVAAKRKVKFYCPSRRRAISTELWAINLDWCCDNKPHFNVIHLLTNLITRRPLYDQSIGSTLSIVIIAYLGHDAIDANAALNFLLHDRARGFDWAQLGNHQIFALLSVQIKIDTDWTFLTRAAKYKLFARNKLDSTAATSVGRSENHLLITRLIWKRLKVSYRSVLRRP